MRSKRSNEGYLLIDHRFSPGVSESALALCDLPLMAGRGLFEAPTYTCSHCHNVVVLNPLRTRDREYCANCDHYICDTCGGAKKASGGICITFNQIIADVQERAAQSESLKEI